MFNKKRMIIFIVFILFIFFMMTFASSPAETVKVNTRKVVFTDGYNSREIASYDVEVGKGVQVPQVPTHDSVVFAGWYDYYDNNVKVEEFDEILNDTHVIALYGTDLNHNGILDDDEEHFLVRFIHGLTNEVLKEEKVLIGFNATAPLEPTASGYTFTGWDRNYTNVQSDLTVNANFRSTRTPETNIRYYRVTFVDGENNEVITSYQVREGYSSSTPNAPTHVGRVFDHWNGTWTNVRSNQTVTAVYVDDKNHNNQNDSLETHYSVEFTKKGEGNLEGELVFLNLLSGLTFKEQNIVVPTATPKNDYYKFDGWNPEINTTVTGNAKYEASFSPKNDNFGTNGTSDGIADEEQTYKLTIKYIFDDNKVSKEDDVFERKYTERDYKINVESVEHYSADKEYVEGTITSENKLEKVEIVNYTRNKYTVTFINNDTQETITSEVVASGSDAELPEAPVLEKRVFVSWQGTYQNVTSDQVVKAMYADDLNEDGIDDNEPGQKLVVKFYNEKTVIKEETVLKGMDATAPTDVVKESDDEFDYTFSGWDKNYTNVQTNLEVHAEYTSSKRKYILTIDYKYEDGSEAATSHIEEVANGSTYSVNNPTANKDGYHTDSDKVTGVMPKSDTNVTVIYKPNTNNIYYVEHYTEKLDGKYELKETETKNDGVTGSTVTAVAKEYKGYEVDLTVPGTNESEVLTSNNDVVLKLFYKRSDVKYTVKVFYDEKLEAETEYTGKYGDVINSSTYINVPSGMKLNSSKTTESIILGNENIINIYYESTHVELSVTTNVDVSKTPAEYGDKIIYTVTIKNTGDGKGRVVVKDAELLKALYPTTEDPLISIGSSSVKINGEETTDYTALDILSSNGLIIDDMLPNQEFKIELVATIEANAGATITSQVSTTVGETTRVEEANTIHVEKTITIIRKTEVKVGANIIVVLDESGSMGYDIYGRRVNKYMGAKEATQSFIDKVFTKTSNSHGSTVSVFTFGTAPCGLFDRNCINYDYKYNNRSLGTATNYRTAQTLKYDIAHSLPNYPYDSGTPYFLGLKDAYNALYGEDGNGGLAKQYPDNKNVVIFLSDGEPDETDNEALRESYLSSLNDKNTVIYTIGYDVTSGSEAYNMLVHLAGSEDKTYLAGVSNLMSIFSDINTAIQDISGSIQTEEGVAEIGNVIYADKTHPIVFNINKNKENAMTKSYISIPAAKGSEYLTEDENGYFHINASKFSPGDTIEFVYYKLVS